jgi:hypothetical protein
MRRRRPGDRLGSSRVGARISSVWRFEPRISATIFVLAIVVVAVGVYLISCTSGTHNAFVLAVFAGSLAAFCVVGFLFMSSEHLGALIEADKRAHNKHAGLALIMDDAHRVLVCLQTSPSDAWSGMWLPPGGYKADADLSTSHTAVRRTRELVGELRWENHGLLAITDNSPAYHRVVREAGSEPIWDELFYLSPAETPFCKATSALPTTAMWIGLEDLEDLPTPPHFRTVLEFFMSRKRGSNGAHATEPRYWDLQAAYEQLQTLFESGA